MKTHPNITEERILEAVEEDANLGFCIECGEEREGVEPDAQAYKCPSCGRLAVYGAEELLLLVSGY